MIGTDSSNFNKSLKISFSFGTLIFSPHASITPVKNCIINEKYADSYNIYRTVLIDYIFTFRKYKYKTLKQSDD